MSTKPDTESWHLDKKVPIVLLMALVGQFAGMAMFVGSVKSQGDENTRRISALEAQKVGERLSSLEAQVIDAKALLIRIDDRMTRRDERNSLDRPTRP